MRADCLRRGQIGMGFWEARYLFIEKSIPYVPALSQWFSTPPTVCDLYTALRSAYKG